MEAGKPATQLARDLGMSRATLYRRISEIQARDWLGAQA
jgi:DNA-binding phage protein